MRFDAVLAWHDATSMRWHVGRAGPVCCMCTRRVGSHQHRQSGAATDPPPPTGVRPVLCLLTGTLQRRRTQLSHTPDHARACVCARRDRAARCATIPCQDTPSSIPPPAAMLVVTLVCRPPLVDKRHHNWRPPPRFAPLPRSAASSTDGAHCWATGVDIIAHVCPWLRVRPTPFLLRRGKTPCALPASYCVLPAVLAACFSPSLASAQQHPKHPPH